MLIHLSTPISQLTRVGAVTAKRLAKLGISNVKELLEHYPSRFEDYTTILNNSRLLDGLTGSFAGKISSIEKKESIYKKMKLTEAWLDDGKDFLKLVWFNQPFINDVLREGEQIVVAGRIEHDFDGWVMKNPLWEKARIGDKTLHTACLVPIYPTTYGLTQKQIRFLMSQALKSSDELCDFLPDEIKKSAQLISKSDAIRGIHNPSNNNDYQQSLRRLKFDELLLINLATLESRKKLQSAQAPAIAFQEQETKKLVSSLPFKLTDDQRKVAWQILQDMSKERPMNRLLQGEVGSGKTVVAAIAALNAAESGFQTAVMAPTEILALQHFATISKLFPDRYVALLTNKYNRLSSNVIASEALAKRSNLNNQTNHDYQIASVAPQNAGLPRNDIKRQIAAGQIAIIIGTHAIIQNDVIFHKLGLIVIDEQHRFGVEQRKLLKNKAVDKNEEIPSPFKGEGGVRVGGGAKVPHLLSMTATPIPRSLALTLYGDLDISIIRQMPTGRKSVITRIVDNRERDGAYEFIKQKIADKEQCFVVCPLIDESDALGVKAATAEYEKLRQALAPINVGLLHGRLKSQDKEKIMADFKQGIISVLVTTAVIEVGVDVPNATIMIIEGADRFGLAQLHQFRGRVGRSDKQSYCLLFTDSQGSGTRQRLTAFTNARDGFEIAELDLQLRGPGQIYGATQSGWITDLKIASLTDSELIAETKKYGQEILDKDTNLDKYPSLRETIAKYQREMHWE